MARMTGYNARLFIGGEEVEIVPGTSVRADAWRRPKVAERLIHWTPKMTAEEWASSSDPVRMLESVRGRVSDYKVAMLRHAIGAYGRRRLGLETIPLPSIPPTMYAAFVREIIGNPWRPPSIEPALLTWQDGAIPRIAQRIYDEQRWGEMPILGQALEDAGCEDAEILQHCRQLARCQTCKGNGYQSWPSISHPQNPECRECKECNSTGWRPKPVGCCRGCFVVDLLTGRS
jgi:hypothetical protein